MSVRDANCGDVYRDEHGKLWLVRWTCSEPTVGVVELSHEPLDEYREMSGGVSGLMWAGFEKLETAKAIETRSAKTPKRGLARKGESAVGAADLPESQRPKGATP